MDNLAVLLLLQSIPQLGLRQINRVINKLLEKDLCIKNILELDYNQLQDLGFNKNQIKYIINPNWEYYHKQIELAKKYNVSIISIYDTNYPRLLKQIYDPPVVLYIMGCQKIISSEQIAIVGTRKPTIYGKKTAEYFCKEIISNGYIVTSGYALGIDITAHLAALKLKMPTIAVLGTSLDYIYPTRHKEYVNNILDYNGAIISEFGFTTPPHPSCFPRRNRIISGLSKGVLVIEAARKSGSLITARTAMEQNREVFAVPGNINNTQALGCLDLISDGAKLVIEAGDIIEELQGFNKIKLNNLNYNQTQAQTSQTLLQTGASLPKSIDLSSINHGSVHSLQTSSRCHNDNNNCNKIEKEFSQLLNLISGGTTDFDTIVESSQMQSDQVSSMLVQLEIMGYIQVVSGGYVKIN